MAQDVNVVVVFYSRTGQTEKLALNAAVGAVQARANIRLRRLPEIAADAAMAAIPSWSENHQRMNREYVAPREADALWADAIIAGVPAQFGIESPEMKAFVDWLAPLGLQGKLDGKLGTAFTSGSVGAAENDTALFSLCAALAQMGLIVAPFRAGATSASAVDALRVHGRRMGELARKLKSPSADQRQAAER